MRRALFASRTTRLRCTTPCSLTPRPPSSTLSAATCWRAARATSRGMCAAHVAIPTVAALDVLAQYHLARDRRNTRLAFAVLAMAAHAAPSTVLTIDARDAVADE
ncbi:hypothetical protein AURDEDRAFT_178068 [Auricularia subglabra TFB-10046 SS5]|uniref:Uncharacterized protein n=1 Tax=Auricularia subglabra (strain TFB-10046 / SS5) TaxID=717982 RepID=J0WKK2_AURST|nr:hypothetical protein AURDEDRAFT_178068 [Auricularia subglabra TFB-10046 SS5]